MDEAERIAACQGRYQAKLANYQAHMDAYWAAPSMDRWERAMAVFAELEAICEEAFPR